MDYLRKQQFIQRSIHEAAAVQLQAAWRGHTARGHAARRECAVVALQSRARGLLARRHVSRLRAEAEAESRHAAALKLQALARGRAARVLSAKRRAALQERAAAAMRGASARQQFSIAVTAEQREQAAAVWLQSTWRAMRARQRTALLREQRDEARAAAAALRLQCVWRGRRARRLAARLRQERRVAAAVGLQCAWRQRLARREAQMLLGERSAHAAAIRIQSEVRAHLARQTFVRMKEEADAQAKQAAALSLQSLYRGRLARRKVAELRAEIEREAAATVLQAGFRGHLARRKLLQRGASEEERMQAAAALLAGAWQRYKLRKLRDAEREAAVLVIQARIRGFLARRAYRKQRFMQLSLEHAAAVVIQAAWRRFLACRVAAALRQQCMRPVLLRLVRAKGLAAADRRGKSDPFVVVCFLRADGTQALSMKSKVLMGTLSPVWEQELLIPAVNEDMQIVLTVLDWDVASAPDFLGQASILSSAVAQSGIAPFVLPLADHVIAPLDEHGVPLKIATCDRPGQGMLVVELESWSPQTSKCGWLLRQQSSLFKRDWVLRWVVLAGDELLYYRGDAETTARGRLPLDTLQTVRRVSNSDHHRYQLEVRGKEVWLLRAKTRWELEEWRQRILRVARAAEAPLRDAADDIMAGDEEDEWIASRKPKRRARRGRRASIVDMLRGRAGGEKVDEEEGSESKASEKRPARRRASIVDRLRGRSSSGASADAGSDAVSGGSGSGGGGSGGSEGSDDKPTAKRRGSVLQRLRGQRAAVDGPPAAEAAPAAATGRRRGSVLGRLSRRRKE
eukprot:PLAT4989.6.p1 GENE.PLAT4989.6~~PLAT4989.6.p1  ORF type:complete len:857 (-),score=332.87 PLAT4989.6:112-2505(-)